MSGHPYRTGATVHVPGVPSWHRRLAASLPASTQWAWVRRARGGHWRSGVVYLLRDGFRQSDGLRQIGTERCTTPWRRVSRDHDDHAPFVVLDGVPEDHQCCEDHGLEVAPLSVRAALRGLRGRPALARWCVCAMAPFFFASPLSFYLAGMLGKDLGFAVRWSLTFLATGVAFLLLSNHAERPRDPREE